MIQSRKFPSRLLRILAAIGTILGTAILLLVVTPSGCINCGGTCFDNPARLPRRCCLSCGCWSVCRSGRLFLYSRTFRL